MSEQAKIVDLAQLRAINRNPRGLYGTLKLLLELAKEDCEKFAEAGNMEAVTHFDTLLLLNCLKQMKRSDGSLGGAIMRQLDEFEAPQCWNEAPPKTQEI